MVYVHSNKILANPLLSHRLYYILEPLLPNDDWVEVSSKKNIMRNLLDEAREASKGKHLGQLNHYRIYHRLLKHAVAKTPHVLCYQGISPDHSISQVDWTPSRVTIDPFAGRFRFTDELSKLHAIISRDTASGAEPGFRRHLDQFSRLQRTCDKTVDKHTVSFESFVQQLTYLPIMPLLLPHTVTEKKVAHRYPALLDAANEEHSGIGFGQGEKSFEEVGMKRGCFQWGLMLYDAKRAKAALEGTDKIAGIDDPEESIENQCLLNRVMTAAAISTVIDAMGVNEIKYFGSKTSQLASIMQYVHRLTGRKIDDFGGLFRTKNIVQEGLCDASALGVIRAAIVDEYKQWRLNYLGVDTTKSLEELLRNAPPSEYAPLLEVGQRTTASMPAITKMAPPTCWKNPFYRCEFGHGCNEVKPNCAAAYFETFPQHIQDAVRKHTTAQGYTFGGIELDIQVLNDIDEDVASFDQQERMSWKQFRLKHGILQPLDLRGYTWPVEGRFQIRPSELGKPCQIAHLIDKMDKKLHFPLLPGNELADVGTGRHKIANTQPSLEQLEEIARRLNVSPAEEYLHNQTLANLGIAPLPRSAYCERQIQTSIDGIVVRGSPDAVMRCGDLLCIFDYKTARRGAYESKTVRRQLLTYAIVLDQLLGKQWNGYLLIAAKRYWHGGEGLATYIEYSMIHVPKDDPCIEGLRGEILATVREQRTLLQDKDAFAYALDCKPGARGHRKCLEGMTPKGITAGAPQDCARLAPYLLENHDKLSSYFLQDVDLFGTMQDSLNIQ
ncbi:hypothetical protein HY642_03155 [Candidatus Woesearchaeota archaeon]|nr:hypothetical protein [Candidatus Woesearchaeota archaeon]